MSEPHDKDRTPESGVDIFNTQPTPKQDQGTAGIKAETGKATVKGAALSAFASKLRPLHFGAAVVIIAATWIGWPYVFSSSPSSDPLSNSSRMLAPSDAMSDASREQPHYPASAPQASASNVGASAPVAASGPVLATPQLSAKETELQAKVDELQGKLAAADAQATKCPTPQVAAVSKPKPRAHRAYSAPRRYVSSGPVSGIADKTAKPGDFTLNTIYREQAWIQNSERTYVVQAGDVINGLRIVRVEPSSRQVVTSLGTIR